jgi:hypothetical protein
MDRWRWLLRCCVFFLTLAGAALEARAQVEVGRTTERCDPPQIVTFREAKGGAVQVAPGQTKTFDLVAPVRELEWLCDDDQEFSSNDTPYDRVRVRRHGNTDEITLVFLRLSAPSTPDPDDDEGVSTPTGDTKDACDKSDLVTFQGRDGEVEVRAGKTVTADLPAPVHEMQWSCGSDDDGRVANDSPFDRVRVTRAANGAITWVFFLKTAAADPVGVCDTVHATGRFFYRNENGDSVPLGRVQVKLMDEDFGPTDHEMAVGKTDSNGRFELQGKGGDSGCVGAGCRRPDPYVEFVLFEEHRVDVRDPLGNTARQKTAIRVNSCGEIAFGDQEWSEAASDPILFANTQTAYTRFTAATGDSRVPGHGGMVEVEFPTVLIWDTPYTTWHTIHWPSNWNPLALALLPAAFGGDPADNFDAIYHEFGHRLRHTADGDAEHFNWDMHRFQYARSHHAALVSNEGFAFNEGWAQYHKSLFTDIIDVSNPDGTWPRVKGPDEEDDPVGDNVEGDVANQLFILSRDCGGFAALWATMKDAGPDAFHSIDEYRAEFMQRNPRCGARIRMPSRRLPGGLPGGSAPAGRERQPSSGKVRSPRPGGSSAASAAALPPQQRAKLASSVRSSVADHLRAVETRRPVPASAAALRVPAQIPAASRPVVQRLLQRRVEIDQEWHDEVTAAYREAIDSLQGLPIEALADGSYEAKRRAAIAAFDSKAGAARSRRLQALHTDLARERAQATEPRLVAYLDRLEARYAAGASPRAGASRARLGAASKAFSEQLPKSFWGTTKSRSR